MDKRIIDENTVLIPYYPDEETTLPWYQDLELCRQVDNIDHPYSLERLRSMYSYLNSHGDCFYIQYQGILIGDITLCDNGDISIVISRPNQNLHIGRKCIREILKLADEKNMDRVQSTIYSFNIQSRKAFLAVGFMRTGEETYEYSRLIGLKRGTVVLKPHCDIWNEMADKMIDVLRGILQTAVTDIQHVGSTAINGLPAKPIIDLAVGAVNTEDIMAFVPQLQQYGIEFRGEDHPGQLLFSMGDFEEDIITFHIHVAAYSSDDWNNYIYFRDYLNSHPEAADEYLKLKEDLYRQFADDRKAYTAGKHSFIDKILSGRKKEV